MNDSQQFEGDPRNEYQKVAQWLQQVLKMPPSIRTETSLAGDIQLELLFDSDYHLHFYQQLPDFIMALLSNDPRATIHYAPLLYHLAGCSACHSSYLDLYGAMYAAIHPNGPRPLLGQGTRTLAATPHRMLAHLCQSLISQAEAVLRQARHDHTNEDISARSLLQLALRVSARIAQSHVRRHALRDLVRVATLFDGPGSSTSQDIGVRSYTPTLAGAGGKTLRRTEMPTRPIDKPQDQPIIHLQSHSLEGSILQHERTLELHLQDLDEALRGHHVTISVPLGSLLEPVRWLGGNPRAIRSTVPVDASGLLITPLGETELQLSNIEERNLLEAMFMLLEVRADL